MTGHFNLHSVVNLYALIIICLAIKLL